MRLLLDCFQGPKRRSLRLGWLFILLALAAGSCIPRKRLAYFQPTIAPDARFHPPSTPYRLQPGDVLTVRYLGPDEKALQPFGAESETGSGPASAASLFLTGYSVSDSGTIYLPILGNFRVINRTLEQVESLIQVKLDNLVRGAVAKVRLGSFKIAVLGEVRSAGTFYIYNERLALPEALGYAGDLTDNADRQHLRLIRRSPQGEVLLTNIDLTDKELLNSPYFYLQPNDVLYAVPLAQKADRLNLPVLSIGFSALTTVLVIINLIVTR